MGGVRSGGCRGGRLPHMAVDTPLHCYYVTPRRLLMGETVRLTDAERARVAELCQAFKGPLGAPTEAHVTHLALGAGLWVLGRRAGLPEAGDVPSPVGSPAAVRVGEDLGEVRGLMARVDVALSSPALGVRKARGVGAEADPRYGDAARERVRVATQSREEKNRRLREKRKAMRSGDVAGAMANGKNGAQGEK